MSRFAAGVAPIFAVAACATLILNGCSSADSSPPANAEATSAVPQGITRQPNTAAISACGPDSGKTLRAGQLTIATDAPAYAPWFIDGNPSNGQGFEGAVAQAVSERLGYSADKVTFTQEAFDDALQPGPKSFDFDIDQFTILDSRRENVDFSSPYYAVTQSVVTMTSNPAARAQSLADLSKYRLGAAQGSSSLDAITTTLHPKTPPAQFPTNDDAKRALADGVIDALIVDFPTGMEIAGNQVPGSVLVGQFPRSGNVAELFGLLLAKNSPLTPCASAAVDSLYADGTLDRLAEHWLCSTTGVRMLA